MTDRPVLILVDDFGQGGAQRQIAMMVREFVARGREVIVARYAERDFLGADIVAAGAEVLRLEGSGRLGWIGSLARLVRARRPAVICAFLVGPATLALLAKSLRRLDPPIVVCERCTDSDGPVALKRRMSLALYGRADAIVCNSRRQADWLVQTRPALRERVRHIGNAVDLDRFASAPWAGTAVDRILVLGRVVEAKGVGVLARALDLLRARPDCQDMPPVEWHGQQHADGPELCRAAGASGEGIRFLPPEEGVPHLIGSADALLLPSVSGEGTPNVILEAMSVGRLVIATDVGDSADIVDSEQTGWIVPPNDHEALADALVTVRIEDVERIRSMSLRSRKRIEEIASIERITDDYESVFERIGVRWQ